MPRQRAQSVPTFEYGSADIVSRLVFYSHFWYKINTPADASGTYPVDDAAEAEAPEGETTAERNTTEALKTAREIKAAVVAAGGRYCWVAYHDGGYTAELEGLGHCYKLSESFKIF